MGKRRITVLLVAFMALVIAVSAGCNKAATPWESMELTSIIASPYRVSIPVSATFSNLSISAIHSKAGTGNLTASGGLKVVTNNLTYKSSDENIAVVSAGGQITGVAVGTTNITVTYAEGNMTKSTVVPVTITAAPGT